MNERGVSLTIVALILLMIAVASFSITYPIITSNVVRTFNAVKGVVQKYKKLTKMEIKTIYAFKDVNGTAHILVWNAGDEEARLIYVISGGVKYKVNETIQPGQFFKWEGSALDEIMLVFKNGRVYKIPITATIKIPPPMIMTDYITETTTITTTMTQTETTTTTITTTLTGTTTLTTTVAATETTTTTYVSYTTTTGTLTTTVTSGSTTTTTITEDTEGPPIFIINIQGVSYYDTPQGLTQNLKAFAESNNLLVVVIDSWDDYEYLLKNPPKNIVVINAHGSNTPILQGSAHQRLSELGKIVMKNGWIWVSIGTQPFSYVQKKYQPPDHVGESGLDWFLEEAGGDGAYRSGETQILTGTGQDAADLYDLNPPESIMFTGTVEVNSLDIVYEFYTGDYLASAFVKFTQFSGWLVMETADASYNAQLYEYVLAFSHYTAQNLWR